MRYGEFVVMLIIGVLMGLYAWLSDAEATEPGQVPGYDWVHGGYRNHATCGEFEYYPDATAEREEHYLGTTTTLAQRKTGAL